jgi:uncharacterized protein GlcG (DUF336 family)
LALTLEHASIIVDKALEKGRELGFKPLTVAVLDAGGHLTALKREDGSSIPVPGGVLIRDAAGDIIGAVGISGDTSENDEACAVYGVKSAGLVSDTGDPA